MATTSFDRLVHSLDYPMVVVTAATRREVSGCLVGFHTQCSLDPPRYCVYLSKANHTYGVARRASHLIVHFLERGSHDLAMHFGELTGDVLDKFEGIRWRPGPDGRTPLLADAGSWFVGKIERRHDDGDHVAFILEPREARRARRFRQLGSQQVRDLHAAH